MNCEIALYADWAIASAMFLIIIVLNLATCGFLRRVSRGREKRRQRRQQFELKNTVER